MLKKAEVLYVAIATVNSRIKELQANLDDLREGLASDTKSTAGDKHETGRAMAHLEQEKLAGQIALQQEQLNALKQIDPDRELSGVAFGSLVQTSGGTFFLSAGLGKITVKGSPVFCITAGSPLGQQLLGKKKGDSVRTNQTFEILDVR